MIPIKLVTDKGEFVFATYIYGDGTDPPMLAALPNGRFARRHFRWTEYFDGLNPEKGMLYVETTLSTLPEDDGQPD